MSRRIKFGVFAFLLLAVLLVCGFMVGRELLSRQKEKEDFEQLAKLVTVKSPAASPTPTGPPAADGRSLPADRGQWSPRKRGRCELEWICNQT